MFSARLLLVFSLAPCLVGCARDWGTAEGTVGMNGKNLTKGLLTFHPVGEGPVAYASLTEAGTFRVMTGAEPGLKIGDYVVSVVDQTIPTMGTDETAKLLTPEKYASAKTSDLKVTIHSGFNKLDLQLKN